MSTDNTKIKATADILGGTVFYANEQGVDPEYPDNSGLLANGMYIRLEGSDGSIAYISAYEIDKAIGIIGEMSMSKASSADVEVVIGELADKASINDVELLRGEVNNRASKSDLDNLSDAMTTKVDQSVVDEIIAQLASKVNTTDFETLSAIVETKADKTTVDTLTGTVELKSDKSTVEELQNNLASLQEIVNGLTNGEDVDKIAAISAQIAYLNNELKSKLNIDDIIPLSNDVAAANTAIESFGERLDNVEVNLSKKATTTYVQGQVSELNGAITGLATQVEAKADKTALVAKADKTELDTFVNRVNELGTKVADIEYNVDNNYDELTEAVENKADKTTTESAIAELESQVEAKANQNDVNASLTSIIEKLNQLKDTYDYNISDISNDIEEVECELNNAIIELKSSINNQNKQITQQTTKISKLEIDSGKYSEQLKQTWVRVLSTNEYKKLLSNPPSGMAYHPRYKYPNTVYLIVDFNKPKALYIGDIMIARAEQKGSIGFAYTFPIIFS